MIIEDVKDFGAIIRKHRKNQQITQRQIAALAGVSPRLVSELERGKATIEIGRAFRVAKTLGLTIEVKEDIWGAH